MLELWNISPLISSNFPLLFDRLNEIKTKDYVHIYIYICTILRDISTNNDASWSNVRSGLRVSFNWPCAFPVSLQPSRSLFPPSSMFSSFNVEASSANGKLLFDYKFIFFFNMINSDRRWNLTDVASLKI